MHDGMPQRLARQVGLLIRLCRGRDAVSGWIEDHLNCGPVVKKSPMGSSSWSSASVYHTESGPKFFVKEARSGGLDMFRGEALGLQAMHGEDAGSNVR